MGDIKFTLTPVKEKQHDKKTIEKTPRKTERINNFKDIEIDANLIAKKILQAAQESLGEEDLKLRVENILRINVCDPLGIPWARYEKTTVVSRSRSDALYGKVIIEYEDPDTFKTRSGFQKSIEQLKKYITEEAEGAKIAINKFFGVALDGFKIGFIRYSMRLQNWDIQKPTPVNKYSTLKFLEAIRGLTRKPLDAKLFAQINATVYQELNRTDAPDEEQSAEKLIENLVNLRNELREAKQWQQADMIRAKLDEVGIALEDTAKGTVWKRKR